MQDGGCEALGPATVRGSCPLPLQPASPAWGRDGPPGPGAHLLLPPAGQLVPGNPSEGPLGGPSRACTPRPGSCGLQPHTPQALCTAGHTGLDLVKPPAGEPAGPGEQGLSGVAALQGSLRPQGCCRGPCLLRVCSLLQRRWAAGVVRACGCLGPRSLLDTRGCWEPRETCPHCLLCWEPRGLCVLGWMDLEGPSPRCGRQQR